MTECKTLDQKNDSRKLQETFILFIAAFLIRAIYAYYNKGFQNDMACFYQWSLRVSEVGFHDFYSKDIFSDYPPGYLYILYPIGILLKCLNYEGLLRTHLFILKMPAVICDILIGVLIHKYAFEKKPDNINIITMLWLFNPAIILDSSVWGQVDSVFMLPVTIMCIFLSKKKTIPAYFAFAIGILIKPQTLIFTPLILFGIYENVFRSGFKKDIFLKNLFCGLIAIGTLFAAFIPFGIKKVIDLYFTTMASYPYVSVNAYNFWSMLGLNWFPQEELLFNIIAYKTIGSAVIPLICIFSTIIFIKNIESKDRYWTTGTFIIITMFLFSVRMHERYLYPVMIFLFMTYCTSKKKITLLFYILFSLLIYANTWHVLRFYSLVRHNPDNIIVRIVSAAMFILGIAFYCYVFINTKQNAYKHNMLIDAKTEA